MQVISSPSRWRAGWLRTATRINSPNYNRRPAGMPIDLIVVHSISLPPGEYGTGDVRALFTNQLDFNAHPYYQGLRGLQVSSHFVITRSGGVEQYVSCDHRAWHAGLSHYRGRSQCNDDSIGIELEGLEGGLFRTAQYRALTHLCACLIRRYPIRFIAGHEHIAPGRKHDPGTGFAWSSLRHAFAGSGLVFPPGT